jgi:hypothetical protein
MDVLTLIAEESDKATTTEERHKLLQELLDKSDSLSKDHPTLVLVWLLRAAAAVELNRPVVGWEAGKRLKEVGAADAEDARSRRVMAMLERKGWLDKDSKRVLEMQKVLDDAERERREELEAENPANLRYFTNSLGQIFVTVRKTKVLFCIWDTRVKDYAAYSAASHDVDKQWCDKRFNEFNGVPFMPFQTCPVVEVSWRDAQGFCRWLTAKERGSGLLTAHQLYRLPTDAEWSLAVGLKEADEGTPKAKSGRIEGVYLWGSGWPPPTGAGNFADAAAEREQRLRPLVQFPGYPRAFIDQYEDGYATTSPVGSFKANRFGLFDMSGNVFQWCEDLYDREHSDLRVVEH